MGRKQLPVKAFGMDEHLCPRLLYANQRSAARLSIEFKVRCFMPDKTVLEITSV